MKLGLRVQWRLGGVLLFVGGLLSVIGAIIFNFGPPAAGTSITVLGLLFQGGGLITVSFGFGTDRIASWARRLLFATGVVVLVELLVSVLGFFTSAIPAAVPAVLFLVATATLLISAIAIFRSDALFTAVRWALLPAAIFQALDYVLAATGIGGEWWTLAALGALYALAGVVFWLPSSSSAR